MKNKTISFLIGFFILMTFAITANGETTSSEISNPERVISLFIIMSVGMIITMFISLLYYLEKGYSAIMMIISMIFIIILVFSFDYVFDHFLVWDGRYIYADSGLEE